MVFYFTLIKMQMTTLVPFGPQPICSLKEINNFILIKTLIILFFKRLLIIEPHRKTLPFGGQSGGVFWRGVEGAHGWVALPERRGKQSFAQQYKELRLPLRQFYASTLTRLPPKGSEPLQTKSRCSGRDNVSLYAMLLIGRQTCTGSALPPARPETTGTGRADRVQLSI